MLGLKEYEQALELLNDIYYFQKDNNFILHQVVNLTTQGKIYNSQAQYKKAEIILKKALNLLNEDNLKSDKLAVVLELAKTYEAQSKPAQALAQIQSIDLKNKNFEKFIYLLSFVSIFSMQLTTLPIIGQHFLKQNMHIEKFEKTKKAIQWCK